MCDSKTWNILNDVVEEKIDNNERFTAFDVYEKAKQLGVSERYGQVRQDIHGILKDYLANDMYERNLCKVGVLSHQKAFMYSPKITTVTHGGPKGVVFSNMINKSSSSTVRKTLTPVKYNSIPTGVSNIAVGKGNNQSTLNEKVFQTGSEDRLLIRKKYFDKIGINANNLVYVFKANDGTLLIRATTPQNHAYHVYETDKNNNLRLGPRVRKYYGLKNSTGQFRIDVNNGSIVVRDA